jgi:hypothetical protein
LIGVSACGVFCAVSQWVGAWTMVGLALLGLSIVAHVAGNAIGTRLRDSAGRRSFSRSARPRPIPIAPASHLSERKSLGWPILIAPLCGMIAGGLGGGFWTLATIRGPVEPAAIAVGALAYAILGGMAAFATAAFSLVLAGAMWQALRHPASESSIAAADLDAEHAPQPAD